MRALLVSGLFSLSSLVVGAGVSAQPIPTAEEEAAAVAVPSRWRVMGAVSGYWHLDPAWTAFDNVAGGPTGGVVVQHDLTDSSGSFVLGVEVSYGWGRSRGTLRGAWDTELQQHLLQASALVQWQPLRWLHPYARFGAGAGYYDLAFRTQDGSGDLVDADWAFLGSGGIGFQLLAPQMFRGRTVRRGQFVFSVEGGLNVTNAWTVTAAPPAQEGGTDTRLNVQGTTLGPLSATAPYLRFTVGFGF